MTIDTPAPETAVVSFDEPQGLAARGTLILLGGRGETPAVYERFATRISRDAYRVRVLGDATSATDDIRAAALALLADADLPSPKVIVGSDAGAALALEIAATANGIDAVILAGLPAGSADVADQIEARTACPNHQKVLRREVGDTALDRTLPAELLAVAASAVTAPVLAIHGEADAVSPLDSARSVYEELPDAQLFTVVGGRHDILNDVSHRSVASTVTLFLERLKVNGDAAAAIVREVQL